MRADREPWLVPIRIARFRLLHFSTSGVNTSLRRGGGRAGGAYVFSRPAAKPSHASATLSDHTDAFPSHFNLARSHLFPSHTHNPLPTPPHPTPPYVVPLRRKLRRVVVVDHIKRLATVGKVACAAAAAAAGVEGRRAGGGGDRRRPRGAPWRPGPTTQQPTPASSPAAAGPAAAPAAGASIPPGLMRIFSNASATIMATAGWKWMSATSGVVYLQAVHAVQAVQVVQADVGARTEHSMSHSVTSPWRLQPVASWHEPCLIAQRSPQLPSTPTPSSRPPVLEQPLPDLHACLRLPLALHRDANNVGARIRAPLDLQAGGQR